MVASIIAYSLSGSSAKALKRLSQTPFFAQRENRVWTFFQAPNRSGRSRPARPSGTSRSPLRRTGDCPHRCCAQRSRDAPEAELQSAQIGRHSEHTVGNVYGWFVPVERESTPSP